MRSRLPKRLIASALLAGCVAASLGGSAATGATSASVVGATVLGQTTINVAGCPKMTAGVTDFGNVMGSSSVVTSAHCAVEFGSSNDTARLRVAQQDGQGAAMWSMQGMLDPTYGGGDGIGARLDSGNYKVQGLVVADDGSSYLLGEDANRATIWKFDATGAVDTSYGGGDGVSAQIIGVTELWDGILLDDGSILAAGSRNTEEDAVIVRFEPDGDLDLTWGGGDGQSDIVIDGGTCWDLWSPCDIHQLPDGKLLFTGTLDMGSEAGPGAIRYLANGTLDLTYGGGDGVSEAIAPSMGIAYAWITGSVFLADGSVIVTGTGSIGANDLLLFGKLDPNGSLDLSWGGNGTGIRMIDPSPSNNFYGGPLVLLDDGSVVTAGSDAGTLNPLIKFDPNGLLDPTFGGGDGIADYSPGLFTTPVDFEVLPDGRLVLIGTDWDTGFIDWNIWVFDADGSPDETYGGGDGKSDLSNPWPGNDSRMSAGEVLADGKVTLAGDGWSGGYVSTTRYDTVGVASYANGVSDWDTVAPNAAAFGACLHSVASGGIAAWAATGSCTASDADPWNAIPATTAAPGSSIATSPSGDADSVANLRFGFRAAGDQLAGRYIAPIAFEVVAPS